MTSFVASSFELGIPKSYLSNDVQVFGLHKEKVLFIAMVTSMYTSQFLQV